MGKHRRKKRLTLKLGGDDHSNKMKFTWYYFITSVAFTYFISGRRGVVPHPLSNETWRVSFAPQPDCGVHGRSGLEALNSLLGSTAHVI